MVITDQAQFEQLVQEVRDQILSESQGVGEVDIVDNLDSIYSLPALKLNDSGDQVVEAPLSLLSAPAEEAAALARAAAYDANTAAESANSAASSANLATDKTNEAISNAQSATQQAESSADKANTAAQNADEATAQVLSGESERVEAENARQAAETERQSAEEERKSAEEARKLAEQSREQAESSRVSAEESRVTAESGRVTAESSRAQAETERVQKESERESAESTRQQNETTRQSNEDTRVQQEQTRQTNEEQRVSAESSRETEYTDLKQRADALIDDNEAAIENANTAAENANTAIANMENTYAKKDEIPDVSEFITTSVDNLVNYYRKSETYNQEQINSLIGSITTINFKIVDSLPGTGENNLIYLVPSSKQEEKNVKDEYIWVDGSWELIGSTKIDLSNYYTKDEVNSTFALKTELAWDTITGKPVWIGSSKPIYTWSEINEKPTTLAGYGITDAYIKNGTIVLGSNNITPLTSSNYTGTLDGRYVKKSGDKMTGTLHFTGYYPQIKTDENTAGGIELGKGVFAWDGAAGTYIRGTNTGETVFANVKSDSLYWNNAFKFWHAGNDGSGSGLDADLLDGVHKTDFIYFASMNSYDDQVGSRVIPIVASLVSSGTDYGSILQWANTPSIAPSEDSTNNWYFQLFGKTNNTLYYRTRTNGGAWDDWETIAFTTSNVASATKLQTPRTIWGQSFDGTENVDGSITINGEIRMSGAATLGSDLTVNSDLTVKGTIIDSTSSDIRLKSILEQVDYQEKLLSLGNVVDFNYNDTAFSRENSSNLEHRSYTGLIYQNVKEILPQMAHEDDDGYGYLNYLSHDYINLIAGALQQTITKQKQLEKRISILEEENINLKQQLSN